MNGRGEVRRLRARFEAAVPSKKRMVVDGLAGFLALAFEGAPSLPEDAELVGMDGLPLDHPASCMAKLWTLLLCGESPDAHPAGRSDV